jgi:hypothetical protein
VDKVMKILGESAKDFVGINYVVSVPPFTTLKEQTIDRLDQAGLRYDKSREYVMLLYSHRKDGEEIANVHTFERDMFFLSVKNNPTILHFIIANECHWGISANGAHAKLVNNCLEAPNLFVILVSATPFNVLSKNSRVFTDEHHIIDWFSLQDPGMALLQSQNKKEYCRLSNYIANMGEAIKKDDQFETMFTDFSNKGVKISRTALLMADYISSFCWYSVQFDFENFCLKHSDPKKDSKKAKLLMEKIMQALDTKFEEENLLITALKSLQLFRTNWRKLFIYKSKNPSETDNTIRTLLESLEIKYSDKLTLDDLFSYKVLSQVIKDENAIVLGQLHVLRLETGTFEKKNSAWFEAFKFAINRCGFTFLSIMHTMTGTPLTQGISPSFLHAISYKGESWNPTKPKVFEGLKGLPGLLFVIDKARMGDTFPENFSYFDLRARETKESNLSSLIQSLGRLCTYTEKKCLLCTALILSVTYDVLAKKHKVKIDRYLKGTKVEWKTTLKEVEPEKLLATNSYDQGNTVKDKKRLVLCAEPQLEPILVFYMSFATNSGNYMYQNL